MSGSAVLNDDALPSKVARAAPFFLDDNQWAAISKHLPVRQRGPKRLDDRVIISGILYVLQSGCAWRDCPSEYGPYMTVFNRHLRWRKRGIWQRILDELLNNERLPELKLRSRPAQAIMPRGNVEFDRLPLGGDRGLGRVSDNSMTNPSRSYAHGGSPTGSGGQVENIGRALAIAELKAIVQANEDKSFEKWIVPIVEWHLGRTVLARPDTSGADPLGRDASTARAEFSLELDQRLTKLIALFTSDYVDTKTRLISALECVSFYASGGADQGSTAKKTLEVLLGGTTAYPADDSE